MKTKTPIIVAAIALLILTAGCGRILPVKISEIYENTYKYEDKTISVKGEVENSISVFGLSGFILSEGGKKMVVVGHDISPSPGEKITVRGELSVPFRWQDEVLLVLDASQKGKKEN